MDAEKVLCMVGGSGETSYAANSKIPQKAILMTRPMLEEAIRELYRNLLPEKMVVADLGCCSGPNTLVVLHEVIKIISNQCLQLGRQSPEMQFFLNDLHNNDFNNIFQSLDSVDQTLRAEKGNISVPHFVAGLPGSFYGRLFPRQSVHFFHSSFSLMWISQGLVEEENLDTFNLPWYGPSAGEVEAIINLQGIFDIIHIQTFELNLDPFDDNINDDVVLDNVQSSANYAKVIRSVLEPMIACHFGSAIVDDLFSRFATNVAKHLLKEKLKLPVLALSLKKKE